MRCPVGCILLLLAVQASGQFATMPQADTPEEFDDYLRVLEASAPAEVVAAGDFFVRRWPSSALRGHIYELQLEAHRTLGNADRAIDAGEKALELAPENLTVLAGVALLLGNSGRVPERLARAERYARKVLELAGFLPVPKWIPPQQWDPLERRLKSQARAALGLVANQRGNIAQAIREFEAAVTLAPSPDATQYYRLGMLYRVSGKLADARKCLRRAAELDEPFIRRLAQRELATLPPP